MASDRDTRVRVQDLHERPEETDYARMTPAERLGIMWQLALDSWAFQGSDDAQSRLPRHIVSVQRRGR